jgi:hypothetical protein
MPTTPENGDVISFAKARQEVYGRVLETDRDGRIWVIPMATNGTFPGRKDDGDSAAIFLPAGAPYTVQMHGVPANYP